MNQNIIQKALKLSILWKSLTIAIVLAATLSCFMSQSLFAQSNGTSILLPLIAQGGGTTILDTNIPHANISELDIATLDVNDIAQSEGGDEVSSLYRCSWVRTTPAFVSTAHSTYLGYSDRGNGIVDYGYYLSQEVDYYFYLQCGSTYYKYRAYGIFEGSQICNGYKIHIPVQLTCENARWNPWKRTSGYGYQGSGSNAYF